MTKLTDYSLQSVRGVITVPEPALEEASRILSACKSFPCPTITSPYLENRYLAELVNVYKSGKVTPSHAKDVAVLLIAGEVIDKIGGKSLSRLRAPVEEALVSILSNYN